MVTDLREFCRLFYFATAIPLAVIAPDGSPLYAFPSILIDPALFTRNPTLQLLRLCGLRRLLPGDRPDIFNTDVGFHTEQLHDGVGNLLPA